MPGEYPKAIDDLSASLANLPGIGRRTAERLAIAMLDWDNAQLHDLGEQIAELKVNVKICAECGNLADEEICRICASPSAKSKVCSKPLTQKILFLPAVRWPVVSM